MKKTETTAVKTEDTAKAAPVVVLKTVLEPEAKPGPAKAEKPASKIGAKSEAPKAGKSASKSEEKSETISSEKSASKSEEKSETISSEKSASKPEAKSEAISSEKSASKPEAKSEAISSGKSASKPEAKSEAVSSEKSASKPEAKSEAVSSEKSASKPEAKSEAISSEKSASKPESGAGEKSAPPAASVSNPAVTNPPAVSEKPAVQVVDSPLKRMKQEFTERTNVIKQEMRNIQNSFLVIGFQLHWIKANNMYKVLNYKNIMDYAEKEFGIKKSTCCNFINIIETYAERDENGEVIESIAECYRNFSSSQLIAMIGMPEEMQQQVTPDMSVRAINRLRKGEPEQPVVDAPKAVISGAKPAESLPIHEVPKSAVPVHEIPRPAVSVPVHEIPRSTASLPVHEVPKPVGTANSPAANNISKPLENHVPRTLLEIESYSGYRSAVDKIDKLVKEAFKAGKRMKVKLVCEEG